MGSGWMVLGYLAFCPWVQPKLARCLFFDQGIETVTTRHRLHPALCGSNGIASGNII